MAFEVNTAAAVQAQQGPAIEEHTRDFQPRQPSNFQVFFDNIVRHEGSDYTHKKSMNDPPTKWGITHQSLSESVFGQGTKKRVPLQTLKDMTYPQAMKWYKKEIWERHKIDKMPEEMQGHVMDIIINHGAGNGQGNGGWGIITRTLNEHGANLPKPWGWGPQTKNAIARIGWENVNDAVVERRMDEHRRIAKAIPEKAPNLDGWLARDSSFFIDPERAGIRWQ